MLSPASSVFETGVCPPGGSSCAPWPVYNDECAVVASHGVERQNRSGGHVFDHSRLKNMAAGRDAFFRVHADDDLPAQGVYVAHADAHVYKDAVGSFHGVTGGDKVAHFGTAPNGTKFFVYPNDAVGRFWQDWLSGTRDGSGRGNYIEMQIGPAPSQMQTFAMPAASHLDWTEYIMPMTGADAGALHGASYAAARGAVKRWLDGEGGRAGGKLGGGSTAGTGMPAGEVRAMDAYLKEMAGKPLGAGDVMAPGMAWGALEEARRKSRLSDSVPFTFAGWEKELYVRPWAELLQHGRFSNDTLALVYPPSYQCAPEWVDILLESEAKHPSWLHPLLLGVAEAEHAASGSAPYPDFGLARGLFAKSMDRKPNPVAARSLAVTAPTAADAGRMFEKAWALALDQAPHDADLLASLSTELVSFLLSQRTPGNTSDTALQTFVDALPASPKGVATSDEALFARATLAIERKHTTLARSVIKSSRFPTMFEGPRVALAQLWEQAAYLDKEAELGRALSPLERHAIRMSALAQPPANLGPFGAR